LLSKLEVLGIDGAEQGRLYNGRWNALIARWSMCDAAEDWHERAFKRNCRRSEIFGVVILSLLRWG
jgi:hypothetical protein